jgi:NAD(P)-dependent dehydrogenase (short-subunit alcohol dehydrogenase family)
MSRSHPTAVALVTGGGGGIGAAVARRLAADGMRVAVTDLDAAAAEGVAASIGGGAIAMGMDVTSEDSVGAALERAERALGPVDRLAACAGVIGVNPFGQVTRQRWQLTLDVNAWGVYLSLRTVAERLRELRLDGRMVAIASIAGRGPNPLAPDYGASKAAVVNLVRSAAVAYAPDGITVNAVCPGVTETAMIHEAYAGIARVTGRDAEVALKERIRAIALGRIGRPEDVAGAVSFLLSPDAAFITGQALNVCGGDEFD